MVVLAEIVIGERLDDLAIGGRASAAGGHHSLQFRPERCQLNDLVLDRGQLLLCQGIGAVAGLFGMVR